MSMSEPPAHHDRPRLSETAKKRLVAGAIMLLILAATILATILVCDTPPAPNALPAQVIVVNQRPVPPATVTTATPSNKLGDTPPLKLGALVTTTVDKGDGVVVTYYQRYGQLGLAQVGPPSVVINGYSSVAALCSAITAISNDGTGPDSSQQISLNTDCSLAKEASMVKGGSYICESWINQGLQDAAIMPGSSSLDAFTTLRIEVACGDPRGSDAFASMK